MATLRLHHDDQTGNTGLFCHPAISCHAHFCAWPVLPALPPNRVLVRPQTLLRTVLRSYGPRLCLMLTPCLLAIHTQAIDNHGRCSVN
ncbi:hypothetical protein CHELA1G2_13358 [Hyphomicrobiales bacterium]|nr:hypothetical protein CHELA1G2_13358 [Hyphomicrobiales bacterium]